MGQYSMVTRVASGSVQYGHKSCWWVSTVWSQELPVGQYSMVTRVAGGSVQYGHELPVGQYSMITRVASGSVQYDHKSCQWVSTV